jgi:uncharacterized protein with HEPN domain
MKRTNELVFIEHIRDAVNNILEFTEGCAEEDFKNDKKTFSAVVRMLEIIGEATSKLTQEFKDQYPDIPWQDMKDMRNKLIHEYFTVDAEIVWELLQEDIPDLKEQLEEIE